MLTAELAFKQQQEFQELLLSNKYEGEDLKIIKEEEEYWREIYLSLQPPVELIELGIIKH